MSCASLFDPLEEASDTEIVTSYPTQTETQAKVLSQNVDKDPSKENAEDPVDEHTVTQPYPESETISLPAVINRRKTPVKPVVKTVSVGVQTEWTAKSLVCLLF